MEFIQIDITASADFTELLIAEMSELRFDSFWEKSDGEFTAYIEKTFFDEQLLKDLQKKYPDAGISYQFSALESKNWNEEWEKNFQPIVVANKCYVRSTFHEPRPDYPLEIIIEPKMSFGTGHHATTSMMVEQLLSLDLGDKKVMDVGTGSGILAIAASKLGAANILAFDIDEWSVENTAENLGFNKVTNVQILQGTIAEVKPQGKFEIILANITRNILMEEIPTYLTFLEERGYLIVSGFYKDDIASFESKIETWHLKPIQTIIRDNWASILFQHSY
jgi:ribosomal protein L11 methyltransferase